MKLSIVIVTRNTRDMLLKCLGSIADAIRSGLYEVIVVDNASSDGTSEALKSAYPEVKQTRFDVNTGFARASNKGASLAECEILFFLNNDTIATEINIEILLSAFDKNPQLGIVSPRLIGIDGKEQPAVAYLPTFSTVMSSSAKKCANVKLQSALDGKGNLAGVAYLCGAALLIRREAFEEVGGFDERFFFYFEDADLCRQITDNGWGMQLVEDSLIIHLGGGSTRKISVGSTVEMIRSRYQYMEKHYGRTKAVIVANLDFAIRLRRFLISSVGVILTLGLCSGLRRKTCAHARVCLWFLGGMLPREAPLYKRLVCDWFS